MRSIIILIGQFALAGLLLSTAPSIHAATEPAGAAVYQTHCATCHDAAGNHRVPPRSALAQLPSATIQKTLESGVMKPQGSLLTAQERTDVANWLSSSGKAAQPAEATANTCPAGHQPSSGKKFGWTEWGAGPGNQRYQPDSGLNPKTIPHLKLKWAFGVANAKSMRSQSVVYKGRVYLGTETGFIYALDAKTGCTYWSASVKNVRSGLSIGKAGEKDALFFGDGLAKAHALDLETGHELWQTKLADTPPAVISGTPAYSNGHLYVPVSSYEEALVLMPGYHCCRFRGSVSSLDAATGKILWSAYTIDKPATLQRKNAAGAEVFGPAGAAVWSSPTIDAAHHTVYVTTGDNYSDPPTATSDSVLAFDTETGKLLWSKQLTEGDIYNMACGKPGVGACEHGSGPDFDFGAPPILVNLPHSKRALLLGQKSGMVYAVDPDEKGKLLWQGRAGKGSPLGGIEWGMASNGNLLFAAVSDLGFRPSKAPGQINLDPKAGGGLSAFSVSSGKLVWKAAAASACGDRSHCSPGQSAPVTAIKGAALSGSLDGHIRAYSAKDGSVLWDFDTERSFQTVNGVPATGGSLDVAGPVVSNGMVFLNSGYPQFGGAPGNVFLAFGTD